MHWFEYMILCIKPPFLYMFLFTFFHIINYTNIQKSWGSRCISIWTTLDLYAAFSPRCNTIFKLQHLFSITFIIRWYFKNKKNKLQDDTITSQITMANYKVKWKLKLCDLHNDLCLATHSPFCALETPHFCNVNPKFKNHNYSPYRQHTES